MSDRIAAAAKRTDDAGRQESQHVTALMIFRERCEARAILYEACVYSLHEAVDVLQADAERTGLVAEIGQDAVQSIIATAFRAVRTTEQAAIAPDDDDDHQHDDHDRDHVAASTIQAVEFIIQQNDRKRLRTWLAQHTRAERLAIKNHFKRRRA
jgi:hypothetical protein